MSDTEIMKTPLHGRDSDRDEQHTTSQILEFSAVKACISKVSCRRVKTSSSKARSKVPLTRANAA
jgi:hypothetical protein